MVLVLRLFVKIPVPPLPTVPEQPDPLPQYPRLTHPQTSVGGGLGKVQPQSLPGCKGYRYGNTQRRDIFVVELFTENIVFFCLSFYE
jgi:hypothetical protein